MEKSITVSVADTQSTDEGVLDEDALRARRALLIATSTMGALGLIGTAIPFIDSMEPFAKARAEGGPTDVDIAALRIGEQLTAVWRGKPIWLFRRDAAMLTSLERDRHLLADPDSQRSLQPGKCTNTYRSLVPQLAVIVGVCKHLGCSPVIRDASAAGTGSLGADWPGGFFAPVMDRSSISPEESSKTSLRRSIWKFHLTASYLQARSGSEMTWRLDDWIP